LGSSPAAVESQQQKETDHTPAKMASHGSLFAWSKASRPAIGAKQCPNVKKALRPSGKLQQQGRPASSVIGGKCTDPAAFSAAAATSPYA
jgi:hypothetical protein